MNPAFSESDADTHFAGPLAIEAFNAAGGRNYPGKKVPVSTAGDDGHWRGSIFGNEVMSSGLDVSLPAPLSAVTIQSMADMGYEVDVTKADDYALPVTY